ncbi:MAG TPA: hypothetical protein VK401_06845 [Propionibacteriaceae bacterium]|nr:hypothetical protein [Propionibacteriaceae bacterium]
MSLGTRAATAMSGLVGSASGLTAELTSSDAVLRAPLALSRRVGFVQLRGGAGASATTAYVANLLARRRTGMVLAVNASAGERHAVWQAGVAAPPPDPSWPKRALHRDLAADRRAHPTSAADARAGLGVSGSGLYGLDLTRDRLSAGAGSWLEQVSPIARFYDVVLTDWGVRDRRADLRQVGVTSHVVCLVARADRYTVEEAAALVPALQEVEDRPRLVLVLVDVGRTGGPTPALLRRQLSVPVVTIPYEPLQAAEQPPGSRRLPAPFRLAGIRLARAILTEAQHPELRQRSLTALGRSVAEARP